MRRAVERSSAGWSSRFSASRIRFTMVTAKKDPKAAIVHQKSDPVSPEKGEPTGGPYGEPKNMPRIRNAKPMPLVSAKIRKKMTIAPRIREDTARDFERHDRKRAAAHTH